MVPKTSTLIFEPDVTWRIILPVHQPYINLTNNYNFLVTDSFTNCIWTAWIRGILKEHIYGFNYILGHRRRACLRWPPASVIKKILNTQRHELFGRLTKKHCSNGNNNNNNKNTRVVHYNTTWQNKREEPYGWMMQCHRAEIWWFWEGSPNQTIPQFLGKLENKTPPESS